jgi:protein-S-isoprenylcysteine O-methyltransferase Ste14
VTREKLHDLLAAIPLAIWFGIGAAGSSLRALELAGAGAGVVATGAPLASAVFLVLAIVLLFARRPPLEKAKGFGPVVAGVVGCLAPFLVLLAPRAALSPQAADVLAAFGLAGTAAAIYALLWLGRSFSILPQARGLVTDGPYRFVRHPLYLAEFLIILSRAPELAFPWSIVALGVVGLSQIARMRYEEAVLREAFPAYDAYARKTARLVPGLY